MPSISLELYYPKIVYTCRNKKNKPKLTKKKKSLHEELRGPQNREKEYDTRPIEFLAV